MSRWKPETISQRLVRRVVRDEAGCWLWQGHVGSVNGYGYINLAGSITLAHRVSYVSFVGPIPHDLEIDHLCRVRRCINPHHLEPVTRAENVRRARAATAPTHCKRGHEFDPENTYVRPNGGRTCRACKNASSRANYAKERAA